MRATIVDGDDTIAVQDVEPDNIMGLNALCGAEVLYITVETLDVLPDGWTEERAANLREHVIDQIVKLLNGEELT